MISTYFLLISFLVVIIPLFSCIVSASLRKPLRDMNQNEFQPYSCIMVCTNEGDAIVRRVNSFLSHNEWIKNSEILLVVSGYDAETEKVLQIFRDDSRVRLFLYPEKKTKIQAINQIVWQAKNEILIFSDCRQAMSSGSVHQLLKHFSDQRVGAVAARLIDSENSAYRKMLNFLSNVMSKAGAPVNLHGALYAMRKSCFRTIPSDIIFDDLFVITSVSIQRMKLRYEKNAIIRDLGFIRYYNRERIHRLVRGLMLFASRHHRLIAQMPWREKIPFVIYKYLKLLSPFWMMLLCICLLSDMCLHPMAAFNALLIAFSVLLLSGPAALRKVNEGCKLLFEIGSGMVGFVFHQKRSLEWEKITWNEL